MHAHKQIRNIEQLIAMAERLMEVGKRGEDKTDHDSDTSTRTAVYSGGDGTFRFEKGQETQQIDDTIANHDWWVASIAPRGGEPHMCEVRRLAQVYKQKAIVEAMTYVRYDGDILALTPRQIGHCQYLMEHLGVAAQGGDHDTPTTPHKKFTF